MMETQRDAQKNDELDAREAKLRAAFGRLQKRLKTYKPSAKIDASEKFRLELSIGDSDCSGLGFFSVRATLIELKSKLAIDSTLKDLDIQIPSGVVMVRERMLKASKPSEIIWLSFLQSLEWQDLPIELIDLWTELYYALTTPPKLVWLTPSDPLNAPLFWNVQAAQPMLEPKLSLTLNRLSREHSPRDWCIGVSYNYLDFQTELGPDRSYFLDSKNKIVHLRDLKREEAQLSEFLASLTLTHPTHPVQATKVRAKITRLSIATEGVQEFVDNCLQQGITVQLRDQMVLRCDECELEVSTTEFGFELRGAVLSAPVGRIPIQTLLLRMDFELGFFEIDERTVGFVSARAQLRLSTMSILLKLGKETASAIQYQKAQGPILAALFANSGSNVVIDAAFTQLVQQFVQHRELKSKLPGPGFRGSLRAYQQEGLGWLSFLRATGFGGVLADDMGLGKTVQVIAHLSEQYEKNPAIPLSLVILPKSLLFNWYDEIIKFAPKLRGAIYEGTQKRPLFSQIKGVHVLLVTYNTLRQDIEALKQLDYHYVIADEAQAIKNPNSQIHRACAEIRARHRLAISGTPVENSVQDLFSIFDFVSPGLIGAKMKQRALQSSQQANGDLSGIAQALKPFILRRTKEQVLKDLPAKTEKVLYCRLTPVELKRYQKIRDHYKLLVKNTVANQGLKRSGFAVLEGLLRLRQAASHPGLVDKKWLNESSSKLDAFMEQFETVMAMGHKALVFSQFTGLLDIVERHLKQRSIRFVRIDGSASTAQRQASVKAFQSHPDLQVFLISLKAGGTGLNLTAADYVFILDPWWNPAAEAQAIDRAHRMGQKNKVMAYRMIAKGTVEEKIMELQQSKRELAQALVAQDGSMLKALSQSDIEVLFS